MKDVNIVVQIHCLQPSWIEFEKPKYRLYINDDLITERTWIWNFNTFIEEDLWASVPENVNNLVRIETIKERSHLAQFGLQNFKVGGWPKPDHGGHRDTLSFILA